MRKLSSTIERKSPLSAVTQVTSQCSTTDDWNHILCLFNIGHFSSTDCSEVMSKITQKDVGGERVTAKSKPMMNLVSRCSERTPDVLHSTASESPEKTKHESQTPLSAQTEKHHRTERPVVHAQSSSCSEWNVDKTWSSQEWKSDDMTDDRTGRPVVCLQGGAHQIVIEDDETESELSLESRSFLHRVNDQVRKRQKQSSIDATEDSEEHSVTWECSCLQHCKHLYSWERITQTIGIPSRIQKRSHNETDVRHI